MTRPSRRVRESNTPILKKGRLSRPVRVILMRTAMKSSSLASLVAARLLARLPFRELLERPHLRGIEQVHSHPLHSFELFLLLFLELSRGIQNAAEDPHLAHLRELALHLLESAHQLVDVLELHARSVGDPLAP